VSSEVSVLAFNQTGNKLHKPPQPPAPPTPTDPAICPRLPNKLPRPGLGSGLLRGCSESFQGRGAGRDQDWNPPQSPTASQVPKSQPNRRRMKEISHCNAWTIPRPIFRPQRLPQSLSPDHSKIASAGCDVMLQTPVRMAALGRKSGAGSSHCVQSLRAPRAPHERQCAQRKSAKKCC
jgi:hypothetical protein